jgi:hypothetical protein
VAEERPAYHLVIKSPAGDRLTELLGVADGGFTSLATSIQVNSPGTLVFNLLATNTVIPLLVVDAQIEVWRNNQFLFRGLFQDAQYTLNEENRELFQATCYGERDLLARSCIAWQQEVIDRTTFGLFPAETIMQTLVRYNASIDATVANGRLVDYPGPYLSIDPDLGRGNMVARADLMGKVLLDELRELATLGHVDFDVVQTAPQTWVFRVYDGFSGVDRRSSVVFSKDRGNMMAATYTRTLSTPKTVVVAGGSGEGKAREVVIAYGPDYATSYHRELFLADSSVGGALLGAQAAKVLQERRVRPTLTFTPAQVAGVKFGVDYMVGDLVRGVYRDVVADYKVAGVSAVMPTEGREGLTITLEEYQDTI